MNKIEKEKIKISLHSNKENRQNRRFQEHYYCKDGIFYQIPRRDTAEYNEYQNFLRSQNELSERKAYVERKATEPIKKCVSIFKLLQSSEYSNIPKNNSKLFDLALPRISLSTTSLIESFNETNLIKLDPFYQNLLLTGSKNGIASVFIIDSKDNKPCAFQQSKLNMKNEISSVSWSTKSAGIASLACMNGNFSVVNHALQVLDSFVVKSTIWDHQWKYNTNEIILGCEKGMVLYSMETKSNKKFIQSQSDVFSLCIDRYDEYVFYGTRSSGLFLSDFRDKKEKKISPEVGINDLFQMKDVNYLISSSCMGNIQKWDLRMNKAILTIKHQNKYERKLKFSVLEKEEMLIAGGQDKKIYLWCLSNGNLLNTITSNSSHCVNSICFGNSWKKQTEIVQKPNTKNEDNYNREFSEFGFWCVIDGKMNFYSI
jgi:WD40 repeat protein